jgi:glucose/arabinose dehydrogenase
VIRFEDRNGQAGPPVEILRTVSVSDAGGAHNGGRLGFGPDGKLYVTAGNSQNVKVGQDPCRPGGKVLRVNRDGSRPDDNPFPCSAVFASGFRNPFGLAFDPRTGSVFVTDNGGRGHDELNLVRAGANYGHALVQGIANDSRFVDPIWESGQISIGPTGLTFYGGDRLPELKNDLLMCGVHNGQLSQVRLASPGLDRVESTRVDLLAGIGALLPTDLPREQADCRLDVASGPDGAVYFTNFARIMRLTR